jgi:hypothetical protein
VTAELVTALVVVCSVFCLFAGAAAAVRYMKHRMDRAQAQQRLRAEVCVQELCNASSTCMQGAACAFKQHACLQAALQSFTADFHVERRARVCVRAVARRTMF